MSAERRLLDLAARSFASASAEAPPAFWPRRRPRPQSRRSSGPATLEIETEAQTRGLSPPCTDYALRVQASPSLTRCVRVLDDHAEPLPDDFWDSLTQVLDGKQPASHSSQTYAQSQTQQLPTPSTPNRDVDLVSLDDADNDASDIEVVGAQPMTSIATRDSEDDYAVIVKNLRERSPNTIKESHEDGTLVANKQPLIRKAELDEDGTLVANKQPSIRKAELDDGGILVASKQSSNMISEPDDDCTLVAKTQSSTTKVASDEHEIRVSKKESLKSSVERKAINLARNLQESTSPARSNSQGTEESKDNVANSREMTMHMVSTANGGIIAKTRNASSEKIETDTGSALQSETKAVSLKLHKTPSVPPDDSRSTTMAAEASFNQADNTDKHEAMTGRSPIPPCEHSEHSQETVENVLRTPESGDVCDIAHHSDGQQTFAIAKAREPPTPLASPMSAQKKNASETDSVETREVLLTDPVQKRKKRGEQSEVDDDARSSTSSGCSSTATVAAKRPRFAAIDSNGDEKQISRWLQGGKCEPMDADLGAPTYARLEELPKGEGIDKSQGSDHLFALARWPAMLKRRSFAYKMPAPQKQSRGQVIVLWLQLGGVPGEAASCARLQDNWALGLALWMHIELSMPVVAIAMLPSDMHASCTHNDTSQRTRLHRDRAATFLLMRKHLKDWNIPLIGIYCDAYEVTSALASFSRGVNAHILIVPESYSPPSMLLLRHAARAVPCPLFSIDSDCFLPPRYVRTSAEDEDHGDAHRARLSQALSGALDELEWAHFVPCLQPVSDLLCKEILVRGDGAILVPKHVFDRWDLVEPQALEEWIAAESQASRVSEEAVQENLLALERASGEFSRVQLGEILVSHLRQGLLSPFAAARRLRGSQSSLVDRLLFSRECEVLRAYRAFKKSIGKFDLSPPWTMGTGAPIQLLRVSHGASLPGDLEDGASEDHTWNIIQKRILEDGVIWNEAANARYWVDQLVDWSAKPEIGLYLVLRWAAKHIIGGQAADLFMNLTAGSSPEAMQYALALQRNVRTPRLTNPQT